MIIPISAVILTAITWAGNKALPAIWHTYSARPTKAQIQQAKELLEHGDPEAQKIQALQGMQPVYTLQATPVKPELIGPPEPEVKP